MWSEKCASSDRTDSDTTAGQWMKNSTPLATISATSGRVSSAQTARTAAGRSSARHIHAGVPVSKQRCRDEREQHVLHHVHAVEVALGEVVDRPRRAQEQRGDAAEETVPAATREPLPRRPLVPARGEQVGDGQPAERREHVQVHVERGQSHQAQARNEISTMR